MSNCFNICKVLKEYLFYAVLLTIPLTPSIAFSQIININDDHNYSVAGNGTVVDNGKVNSSTSSLPWNSSEFTDSSNNTIIIYSSMSATSDFSIFGSLNYPFTNSSIIHGYKVVGFNPEISCSSNSVIVYNNLNSRSIAYTALTPYYPLLFPSCPQVPFQTIPLTPLSPLLIIL